MMDNIIDIQIEKLEFIDKEFKKILYLCSIDKLKKAHALYRDIDEIIEKSILSSNDEEDKNSFRKKQHEIKTEPRIKRLLDEQVEIEDLLKIMDNDTKLGGWSELSQKSGISCYYKENGSGMHSIRMEGIIESPVFDVCSVIMEVGLYTSWIPKLKEAQTLGTDNRFRRLIYVRNSSPYPVSDRDVCLYGYGVDMLEDEGQVLVVARSVRDGDLEGVNWSLPKEIPNVVRADTKISGFIIKPIDENKTLVKVVALSDPRMNYIPYWLLNFITTQFCHHLFVMLRKQSKSVKTSESYQQIINNVPIYKELKEMVKFFFSKPN